MQLHPTLLGQLALWSTVGACVAGAGLSFAGWARRRAAWARAGRHLTWAAFGFASVASAVLLTSLLGDDFSVRYVAQRSSSSTPLVYKVGAWWGGQEGSLLFWLWLLLGYAAVVASARPDPACARLWPGANGVMLAVSAFFAWVTAALETPFVRLHPAPADGAGLNPLLQSPSMLAHPVALYLGYIGLTVPFAFMAAALLSGDRSGGWLGVARKWALWAWLALGAGILLGGEWAYKELGWGGYWGWDPVENSSLVPWLLLTGFVHTSLVHQHRGRMGRWSAVLLAASYVAVLLGTFVTRSGVLSSVHAFAESPSGPYFLGLVGLVAAFSIWIVAGRWDLLKDLRPEPPAALSREGALLAGDVVLVSLAFAVAFGTAVPIVSRMFGPGLSLQAPYFERVSAPLFTLMLGLMGLGLALPWQPAGNSWARRHLAEFVASVAFGTLLWMGGVRRPLLVVGLSSAFFAGATALAAIVRQMRAPLRRDAAQLWRSAGGLVAHLGVAVVAVAAVASTAFQVERSLTLEPGNRTSLAGYTLRFNELAMRRVQGAVEVYAAMDVLRDGRLVGRLEPARRLYEGQAAEFGPTSEVAVHRGAGGDLYVVLAGWDSEAPGGRAAFEIYFNPLVNWIWAGGVLTLLGTLAALLAHPSARRDRRLARRRILEEALRLEPANGAGLRLEPLADAESTDGVAEPVGAPAGPVSTGLGDRRVRGLASRVSHR